MILQLKSLFICWILFKIYIFATGIYRVNVCVLRPRSVDSIMCYDVMILKTCLPVLTMEAFKVLFFFDSTSMFNHLESCICCNNVRTVICIYDPITIITMTSNYFYNIFSNQVTTAKEAILFTTITNFYFS